MDRRWGGGSAVGSTASAEDLDAANAPARTLSFEEAMSQGSRGRRGSRSSRASHASSRGSRGSGRISESKGQAHADNCSVSTGSHRSDCGAPYGRQCICQMCTCGLHHCPPVPKTTHFEGETVYHHDYPKWPLQDAAPKRVDRPSESGVWQTGDEHKFSGHSEAQDAFSAYPPAAGRSGDAAATAAAARRGNDVGGWDEAPRFEGRSVAQDAYTAPPRDALRPHAAAAPRQGGFPVESAPFEGSSEARDAYKRYNVDPRSTQPLRPPVQELPTRALPFEGRSTAQDAYAAPPPGSARAAMRAPPSESQRGQAPARFEGRSVAQDDFRAPPPEALRQQPGMGPRRSPQTGTPLPFEGSSEAQDAYKRYNIDPRNTRPVRQPPPELPTKALPFEGRSTAQDAYGAPPPVEASPLRMPGRGGAAGAHRGRGYAPPPESSAVLPSAKFEGGTEAAEAYKAYPAAQQDRRRPYRPTTADRSPVKFEGASTSRMDYAAPPPEALARPKSAAPPRGTGASAGPFEGSTEARDAFPAYDVAAARRPPLHTAPRYTPAPDERDFRTSNRTDFTPKKADVCPVLALPKPPQFYEDPKPWKGEHVFYNKRTHRYD